MKIKRYKHRPNGGR